MEKGINYAEWVVLPVQEFPKSRAKCENMTLGLCCGCHQHHNSNTYVSLLLVADEIIISIFHGCMMWIEKSVMKVTDRHHEACRVMPNSDPD